MTDHQLTEETLDELAHGWFQIDNAEDAEAVADATKNVFSFCHGITQRDADAVVKLRDSLQENSLILPVLVGVSVAMFRSALDLAAHTMDFKLVNDLAAIAEAIAEDDKAFATILTDYPAEDIKSFYPVADAFLGLTKDEVHSTAALALSIIMVTTFMTGSSSAATKALAKDEEE